MRRDAPRLVYVYLHSFSAEFASSAITGLKSFWFIRPYYNIGKRRLQTIGGVMTKGDATFAPALDINGNKVNVDRVSMPRSRVVILERVRVFPWPRPSLDRARPHGLVNPAAGRSGWRCRS
jgi:hypothetical protein